MNEGINSKAISKGINIGNYIKAYVNLNSNNSNLYLVINTNTGYQDVRLPIIITMDLLSGKTNNNLNWKVVEQTKEEGKPETILVTGWDNKTYTLTKNDDTKVYTDETKTITLEKMYLKDLNKTTFDSYQITDQLGVTYRVRKDDFQITKLNTDSVPILSVFLCYIKIRFFCVHEHQANIFLLHQDARVSRYIDQYFFLGN